MEITLPDALPAGARFVRRLTKFGGFAWTFGLGPLSADFRIVADIHEPPYAMKRCDPPSAAFWLRWDDLMPQLVALLPPEELAVLAAARIGVAYEPAA